jgi:hypothetical protein
MFTMRLIEDSGNNLSHTGGTVFDFYERDFNHGETETRRGPGRKAKEREAKCRVKNRTPRRNDAKRGEPVSKIFASWRLCVFA